MNIKNLISKGDIMKLAKRAILAFVLATSISLAAGAAD
jgi:hypothetical protein